MLGVAPTSDIDFEAEGLLEGTEGEAREARLGLLRELADDGVPLDELRRAVAEDRLVLLPVERVLAGSGPAYTREELAERAGVPVEFLQAQWRALGMPDPDEDEAAFGESDLEAAKRVRTLRDELGIPDDELLSVTRVIGMNMSQLAAASRGLGQRVFSNPGDTELEVAKRFATVVEGLGPLLTPTLEYVLQLHLREQIRNDVFGDREISEGVESGREIAVAFADLVGFTKLGERLDPAELGALTDRLGELAGDVARSPVRLVKLIGDAAMLSSNDADALLEASLDLVAASEAEGEGFPLLRAGAAYGRAAARAGDYYGRPVNLASRITGVARPGSVLCDEAMHDAAGESSVSWSFAGARKLKGVRGEVKLFRARARAETD
jgi:adenylate cyclase